MIKFISSENATKFGEITFVFLTLLSNSKKEMISQKFCGLLTINNACAYALMKGWLEDKINLVYILVCLEVKSWYFF